MRRPQPQTVIYFSKINYLSSRRCRLAGDKTNTRTQPHTEVRVGFRLDATHRCFCSLIREIRSLDCFGRFFQMNILARTLMDGPSSLFLRKRPVVSEFSLQSPHNAQCPGEIPLIQKCRQLIINAAGLPIYRNNTRGSSSVFRSSRQ